MAHNHPRRSVELSNKLRAGILFSFLILAAEIAGGILTNSVALLADAGHVLTDVIALSLSWYGVLQAARPANRRMTFGYHRIGVLIAVLNATTIVVVAGIILFESIQRIGKPEQVHSLPMMVVAAAGLAVNLFVALWLKEERSENINVRSAFWHAAGDALASIGVIAGGIIITITGLNIVDPIIGAMIGLIIVIGAIGIYRDGLRVLLEAAPVNVKVDAMIKEILEVPGVIDIHDVHVWNITPELNAMSGHVLIADQAVSDAKSIQTNLEQLLRGKFEISHSTLQFECNNCESSDVICSLKAGNETCPKHEVH